MRIAVLSLLPALLFAQGDTGSIEGTVVDTVSKGPVSRVQILLQPLGPAMQPGMAVGGFGRGGATGTIARGVIGSIPAGVVPAGRIGSFVPDGGMQPSVMSTDSGGSFAFRNLAAGRYNLLFVHNRYPSSQMGQRSRVVEVKAGEAAKVSVDLTPGAAVSGRVVDEDGDPIPGCAVQLRQSNGQMQGMGPMGMEPSNENGEYRLWGISPGKYVVTAQCMRPIFQPRPLSAMQVAIPPTMGYPQVYYPLFLDPDTAELIELTPGMEKSGIDFRMKPAPVFSVSGSISPVPPQQTGRPGVQITLMPRSNRIALGGAMMRGVRIDHATGTFEVQGVFPGSYNLFAATGFGGVPGVGPGAAPDGLMGARVPVEVTDRSLRISVVLQPPVDMTGVIQIESDQTNGQTVTVTPKNIVLQLAPTEQFGPPSMPRVTVQEDGNFTIQSVLPGVWRVHTFGPNVFLKAIYAGGREITDGKLDTSGGGAGPLRIVMSTKTATLTGKGPAGQMVHVTSVTDDPAANSYRSVTIDGTGEFRLQGLPPGRYRVAAAEGFVPSASAENSQEVVLTEGGTASVEVRASR